MTAQLLQGNHACALGAVAAGCRFFGGYPITPSSEVAEFMSRELPKLGGKFIQMEDEIASIGAVLGSFHAGQRAMTATSGPGLALMTELIGHGVMSETPAVIATAVACALNSKLPLVNSRNERSSSKKMIWLKAWPPAWKPMLTLTMDDLPVIFPWR